jgi:hypothetical protein
MPLPEPDAPRSSPPASYDDARAFARAITPGARVAVAYHGDADGSGSAAIAVRYLERTGRVPVALAPSKGEDLYGETFRANCADARPNALFVLDQGSRPAQVLPGVPTLVVDHHDAPPEGVPTDVYLSGLGEKPVPAREPDDLAPAFAARRPSTTAIVRRRGHDGGPWDRTRRFLKSQTPKKPTARKTLPRLSRS